MCSNPKITILSSIGKDEKIKSSKEQVLQISLTAPLIQRLTESINEVCFTFTTQVRRRMTEALQRQVKPMYFKCVIIKCVKP